MLNIFSFFKNPKATFLTLIAKIVATLIVIRTKLVTQALPKLLSSFKAIKQNPKILIHPVLKVTIIFISLYLYAQLYIFIVNELKVVFAPPTVVSTSPVVNDIDVPLDSKVTIVFSQPMNKKSVERALELSFTTNQSLQKVSYKLSWKGDTQLIISPETPLERDTLVYIKFARSARALNFRRLQSDYSFSFTTLAGLRVAFHGPSGNITEPVQHIVVMFNKPIKKSRNSIDSLTGTRSSVAESSYNFLSETTDSLLDVTPPVTGIHKWIGSTAYMIEPANLVLGQKYTITLNRDLESLDGDILKKGFSFDFVNFAPAALHISALKYGSYHSYDSESIIDINPKGPFTIYFNQRVSQADITKKLHLTYKDKGVQVPVEFRTVFVDRTQEDNLDYYSSTSPWRKFWIQRVELYPIRPLTPVANYTVTLDAGFAGEYGNSISEAGISLSFMTANLPGFVSSTITNNEKDIAEDRDIDVVFRSPMDRETSVKYITLINDNTGKPVSFYGYLTDANKRFRITDTLARSTKYTLHIPDTLQDKFGRALGQDTTITFTTAAASPAVSVYPYNTYFTTFSSTLDTRIISRVTNVTTLTYNLYSVDRDQFIGLFNIQNSLWKQLDKNTALSLGYKQVGSWVKQIDAQKDLSKDVLFNFNKEAGITLEPGLYFLDISGTATFPGVSSTLLSEAHDNIAFVIGDVSVTTKLTPKSFFVWAASVSEPSVKGGYKVDVIKPRSWEDKKQTFSSPDLSENMSVISGVTNKDGVFISQDNAGLNKGGYYNSEPYITFVEKDGDIGVSMSDWDEGITPYSFENASTDYDTFIKGPAKYTGFAFTDKNLYRPGQRVHYKVLVRQNEWSKFTIVPKDTKVLLKVTKFSDESLDIYSTQLSLDEIGNASGDFVLPESCELGSYFLDIIGENETIYRHTFDVQEYVVPEFEVVTTVPRDEVIRGTPVNLISNANYFYGAPVVNRSAEYTLFKRKYIFNWEKDSGYIFYADRKYFGDDLTYRGFEEEESMSGNSITDVNGRYALNVNASTPSGVSEIYTFSSSVVGEGGRKYSGSDEYVVHMADYYTGIKPNEYNGEVDRTSKFFVATVSPEQEVVADKSVGVNIYRREYFRVKKKDVTSDYYYEYSFKDTLVKKDSLVTGVDGIGTFEFTPEVGGLFIIEAQSMDARSNESISGVSFYVASKDSGYWKRENNDRVDLIPDKKEYLVGDTARIVSTSTLENTIGLLTVEAEDILDYHVFQQESSSDLITVPIKDTYIPNVYISTMLVSPGVSVLNPPEFRIGIQKIAVDATSHLVHVDINTTKDTYAPKETGEASIKLTDKSGRPMSNAEVTVALVDDALISISPIKRADIFSHFYSNRYLNVCTTQSLTHSLDRINANTDIGAKGGSGGKGGAGGEYIDVTRQNFAETALWVATVKTDSKGIAKVKFTLPDSVTRWNLLAVAQDVNGSNFGQGVYKFGSTKDIFSLPALPRFLRVGDSFEVATVVHNNTSDTKDLVIELNATGLVLDSAPAHGAALDNDKSLSRSSTQKVTLVPYSAERVSFNAQPDVNVDNATVNFITRESDKVHDILVKEIPILPYGLESVQSVANNTSYEGLEEFIVNPEMNKKFGGLEVKSYNSLVGAAAESLYFLDNYEYLCTEQLTSKVLPLIYKHKYEVSQDISLSDSSSAMDHINKLLVSIKGMQSYDGGWGFWRTSASDIYNTARALEVLSEARLLGISVESASVDRAATYLQNNLKTQNYGVDNIMHPIYALELAGYDQTGWLQTAYEQRASLSDYGKAYLIKAMYVNQQHSFEIGNTATTNVKSSIKWDSFIKQLLAELAGRADLASGRAMWSAPEQPWYLGNDKATTAIVLRAFNSIDPHNPVANLAARYLAQDSKGSYKITYNEKQKAVALLENAIAKKITLRDTNVTLFVNDTKHAEAKLDKTGTSVFTSFIPINKLRDGINNIVLKFAKGGDNFYSMVLTTLTPFKEVDPFTNGLDITREYLTMDGTVKTASSFKVGESYIVHLTIVAPNIRRNLVLEDFLPAGFESVNYTLTNESPGDRVRADELAMELAGEGDENSSQLYISNMEMRDSKTDIFIDYIAPGIYDYTYLIKAVIPGTYQLRPAQIFEMYSPDIRGATSGSSVTVVE